MQASESYSVEQRAEKVEFIRNAISAIRPRSVLDVGCNDGYYSAIFARAGAEVVAIDQDEAVLGMVWRMARRERLPILPLRVDLARPTPAAGWRNLECSSFLERATGAFDCVLMLAVLHHFLVTERIPVEQILALVSELSTRYAIIEYVDPSDPLFRRIARGRDHLHRELSATRFEAACRRHFRILRSVTLCGANRVLYLLERN
jgi:SAM-dependent methyltransferase